MRKQIIGASVATVLVMGSVGSSFALVPGFATQYNAAKAACSGPVVAANCTALLQAYLLSIGLTGPALQAELAALRADFGTSASTVAAINAVVGGTGAGGGGGVQTGTASGTTGGSAPASASGA